jgi:hypothetical protein
LGREDRDRDRDSDPPSVSPPRAGPRRRGSPDTALPRARSRSVLGCSESALRGPRAATGASLYREIRGVQTINPLWTEPNPPRRIAGSSEVPVHTDCPAYGIKNTRNEDAPLAMTEGGIKPKRLGR